MEVVREIKIVIKKINALKDNGNGFCKSVFIANVKALRSEEWQANNENRKFHANKISGALVRCYSSTMETCIRAHSSVTHLKCAMSSCPQEISINSLSTVEHAKLLHQHKRRKML